MKHFQFASLLLLSSLSSEQLIAQQAAKDQIIVIGSASIEVPADRVNIRISLSFQDRVDGKKAFEVHKDAEKNLVKYLRESNVPDSTVTFSLLNISLSNDYSRGEGQSKIFQTNQMVTVTISDLSKYSEFQLGLISNGFTAFDEFFESSKAPEAMKEAFQKAVQQARSKAELMATAAGRKIKKLTKISDTEDTEPRISSYSSQLYPPSFSMSRSTIQLINIPQLVKIEKQVKVIFELAE